MVAASRSRKQPTNADEESFDQNTQTDKNRSFSKKLEPKMGSAAAIVPTEIHSQAASNQLKEYKSAKSRINNS